MRDRIINTICGQFDLKKYKALKKAFDTAKENNLEQFIFEGQPLLTKFADYFLQFLENEFKL